MDQYRRRGVLVPVMEGRIQTHGLECCLRHMRATGGRYSTGRVRLFAAAAVPCAVVVLAAFGRWGGLAHANAAPMVGAALLAIPAFLFVGTRVADPRKVSRYRSEWHSGMTLEPVIVGTENGRLVFGFPCTALATVPARAVHAGITLRPYRRSECAQLAAPQKRGERFRLSGKSREMRRFRLAGVERGLP